VVGVDAACRCLAFGRHSRARYDPSVTQARAFLAARRFGCDSGFLAIVACWIQLLGVLAREMEMIVVLALTVDVTSDELTCALMPCCLIGLEAVR
jgi:hypothetical protein